MWDAKTFRKGCKSGWLKRWMYRRCGECGLYGLHRNARRHGVACRRRARKAREKAKENSNS